MDTLIQIFFLKIMKINNFQGELTDISAKKAALEERLFQAVILFSKV